MSTGAMQFTPWDSPIGTDGFEFVEDAAPDAAARVARSGRMGLMGMRINEEGKKQAGQFTGGLDRYHVENLERMALGSRELPKSVDARVRSAVQLLDAPDPCDEPIGRPILGHAENEATLRRRRVLVGGKAGELPLQISRENALDAMFCAFIQRKGDWGFGEGNVKALFESLELDWIRRGVVEDGRRLEISAHRQRA